MLKYPALIPSRMDMVDIVDEHDNFVRIASRSEMRQHLLPHRGVFIFVFNSKGELFIHQRTADKDIYPSMWALCVGGGVDSGESYDEAAVRETKEEIGVSPDLKLLFKTRYTSDLDDAFCQIYSCVHDGPFTLQKSEIVQGEFVPLDNLNILFKEREFCPDDLVMWEKYKENRR